MKYRRKVERRIGKGRELRNMGTDREERRRKGERKLRGRQRAEIWRTMLEELGKKCNTKESKGLSLRITNRNLKKSSICTDHGLNLKSV